MLSTEEFKNRMAHFAKTGRDETGCFFNKTGIVLNNKDLRSIRDEIVNPNSPVPLELKQIVAKLNIKEIPKT